jgi:hypothetical protein
MRAVAGEKRKETLLRTVATLAPAMVPTMANKLLGGAGQPEAAPGPVDPAIGAFAESLTDEQRMALSRLLRPEQVAALGMLFQRHGSNGPKRNPGNSGTPSNVN